MRQNEINYHAPLEKYIKDMPENFIQENNYLMKPTNTN